MVVIKTVTIFLVEVKSCLAGTLLFLTLGCSYVPVLHVVCNREEREGKRKNVCIYIYTHTYMDMYIHIYIHTHVFPYIWTHTHVHALCHIAAICKN